MKKHPVLFEHFGENSDTAHDPVGPWHGQVDLETEVSRCLNWDDNRLVKVKRYQVHEVTLPDWLSVEEWTRSRTEWRWAWGFGMDPEWPESWQRWLALSKIGQDKMLAAVRLLRTDPARMRSDFRKSLREQLVTWLETPEDQRQYDKPFSYKQWDALLSQHIRWDAEKIGKGLYHSRGLNTGVPVKREKERLYAEAA